VHKKQDLINSVIQYDARYVGHQDVMKKFKLLGKMVMRRV